MSSPLATPRLRVAAVVVQAGQLLLVRHEKAGQSYWLLPGGGLEFGETLADALRREVEEETGLTVRVGDLLFVSDTIAPDGSRHVVNLCFEAQIETGVLEPSTDHRLKGAAFVPVDELDTLTLYPDIRWELMEGIRNGFRGRPSYLGSLWVD